MRNEIVVALVVMALAGGFLLGRRFPAHHYQPWGNMLLYYAATGRVCNPFKHFEQEAAQAKASNGNPIDNEMAKDDPWRRKAEELNAEKPETHTPPCD